MRKGFSLIEILVVLGLLALLSPAFAKLTVTFIHDVPQSNRIINDNSRMINILQKMEDDIEKSNGLPANFGKFTSDANVLLIDSAQVVICYELNDGHLIRQNVSGDEEMITDKWELGKGKIAWRVWKNQNENFAVEIENYEEQNTSSGVKRKLSNNHIYFTRLLPGGVK